MTTCLSPRKKEKMHKKKNWKKIASLVFVLSTPRLRNKQEMRGERNALHHERGGCCKRDRKVAVLFAKHRQIPDAKIASWSIWRKWQVLKKEISWVISIRWGGRNAKGESQVGFSYLYSDRLITCYLYFYFFFWLLKKWLICGWYIFS